ncbi:hypothetical protein LTR84_004497 [Exophiala bonariae]|uniref:Major facilitator superfamily (MFS) profile domain-containing protein n=1 Tax=Exophiala bonariae TaxID=1690606 RepID=A0AAV9N615_9EURO|nr:hypothetical protein LTR84_004497 [Exophiala bonariae]
MSNNVAATETTEDQRSAINSSHATKDLIQGGKPEAIEYADRSHEPVPHFHAKTFLILFAVMAVYFAQLVHLVGTGAYARAITSTVGGSQDAVWMASIAVIVTVVASPPVSQAADYWGRRWFMIITTFCGVVGSVIIARAMSIGTALAGAVITSLSFGAQPLLHAVASEVITHRNRAAAQAVINAANGLGGITGILMGAAFTQDGNPDGFRNYWYVTAGIYALATIILVVCYTPPLRETQLRYTFREKLRHLDWIGYVLLALGLVLFVMGLSWAENPYSWKDAHVLGPLLAGAVISILFILYEWRFKSDGMIHHRLFSRDRNFAIALGCIFCEGLVFFAVNAFMAYEVSVLYDSDTMRVALHFSVTLFVYSLCVIGPAIYCYKTRRVRVLAMSGFACFLTGNICMATLGLGSAKAAWGYPVFFGAGLAICITVLLTAAQLSAPPELIAITSGLMISVRSLGGAVGLAIYTAAFNSKLSETAGKKIANAVLPLGLPSSSLSLLILDILTGNIGGLPDIPGISPQIIQAGVLAFQQAFAESIRAVWITAACFTAAALVGEFLCTSD